PRPVIAKHAPCSTKPTTRGVVPSVTGVRSLGTPVCHRPSLACHHRPCPGPRPRSTLETHPKPSQRADLQAQAAVYRGDVASRQWGSGGALLETPGQKYRLIYLSAWQAWCPPGWPPISHINAPYLDKLQDIERHGGQRYGHSGNMNARGRPVI